ncbi:MAG: DUF2490 domain-containing protein [Bacteroidetes bacterium]|nr:DUF2490 domain-containing protein [Bacteroidota bacterium]
MRKILYYSLFLFLTFVSSRVFSQPQNDAGLWLDINVEKKITHVFSVTFTEELRMNENITEAGTLLSDLGLEYRFLKKFRIGAHYRYTSKRRLDDSYDNRHRWYVDVHYKEKVRPVTLVLRLRYQSQYTDIYSSEKGMVPKDHLVPKLTIKYDLKCKYEPYIYGETYYIVGSRAEHKYNPAGNPLDQWRICAGVEYTINRMHMIDLHYLVNKEENVKDPVTSYVVGLSYYFTF